MSSTTGSTDQMWNGLGPMKLVSVRVVDQIPTRRTSFNGRESSFGIRSLYHFQHKINGKGNVEEEILGCGCGRRCKKKAAALHRASLDGCE